jgi:hypothetical protein
VRRGRSHRIHKWKNGKNAVNFTGKGKFGRASIFIGRYINILLARLRQELVTGLHKTVS